MGKRIVILDDDSSSDGGIVPAKRPRRKSIRQRLLEEDRQLERVQDMAHMNLRFSNHQGKPQDKLRVGSGAVFEACDGLESCDLAS